MKKERPIIFQTEMVKAIMEGRKTETRRVIKPQPESSTIDVYPPLKPFIDLLVCPYGSLGDILYVRESWRPVAWSEDGDNWIIQYKDAGQMEIKNLFDNITDYDGEKEMEFWRKICDVMDSKGAKQYNGFYDQKTIFEYMPWKPSIHMPKKAARIWLEIQDVWVDRLKGITEESAINEGVKYNRYVEPPAAWYYYYDYLNNDYYHRNPVKSFRTLWRSIHGPGSWEQNPLVWVLKFNVLSTKGKPE